MKGRIAKDIMTKASRIMRLALFVPFLLAQFIASGTMTEAGPDGFRMVLCTTDGLVEVIMTEDGTIHPVENESTAQHDPCPWSVTVNQAVIGTDITAYSATTLGMDMPFGMPVTGAIQQSRHIRPQTRAPPAAF